MPSLSCGRYRAICTDDPADVRRAQRLRWQAFRPGLGEGLDEDRFDPLCRHVLVEETATGRVEACYRVMFLAPGATAQSYAAQFYDIGDLGASLRLVELGRLSARPGVADADVFRLALAMLTRIVDRTGAEAVFGCASFPGTDPRPYAEGLALLGDRHLGPDALRPKARADHVIPFAPLVQGLDRPFPTRALRTLPPLLRAYLGLGVWVGDHAVVDHDLGTLHVFTCLETARVRPERARALRRLAEAAGDALAPV